MAETLIAIGASVSAAASSAAASVSTFFAGGSAAAGSTAAAGTTAAAGSTASTISTALSIGSALSSVAMGYSAAAAQKDQARQIGVQAAQMKAADSQKRASMAEEYADMVSDQQAVQIANGLNPGVGTPATVRAATREFAERNLSTSRENTRNRSRTARMQQRSLYKGANNSIIGGWMQAGMTGADAFRAVG